MKLLNHNSERVPLHAWVLLFASIIAVSSAGAVFQMISSVPPLLRASWRLQATALILFPFAVSQYLKSDEELKSKILDYKNIAIIVGSGFCLWLHFGSWVWSLDHTTLTRSLLFVTSHPLVIVFGMWFFKKPVDKKSAFGALIGFMGAAVVIGGVESEGNASIIGDFAAFIGAVTVVGYLAAGRILREWMPLFVYAFPVTLIAAILLAISSLFTEGISISNDIPQLAVFGWLSLTWLPYVVYLAVGPGIVGHTGINAVLKWFSPLLISVCLVMEPLIGTIIGYFLGTTSVPGIWTLFGGIILIFGTVIVTTAQHQISIVNGE
mgnify:CR=1 FL=1